jgi:hypothetical protein
VIFQASQMLTGTRRKKWLLICATLFAPAALLLAPVPAGAVPVPYKNCGKPNDILQVQTMNASVWPPPTAAPLVGTATIDAATGKLTNLRASLLFGVDWLFDSGNLSTSAGSGFVPLPASAPVSVTTPPLPLAAGPYNVAHTFTSQGGNAASVTVVTKATVSQEVGAPLTNLSLTFNGTPGFPLQPIPGTYAARVRMTLPSGAEVFCVDLALENVAFVNVATVPEIPMLSHNAFLALLVLVGAAGFLALHRRSIRARRATSIQ